MARPAFKDASKLPERSCILKELMDEGAGILTSSPRYSQNLRYPSTAFHFPLDRARDAAQDAYGVGLRKLP